MIACETRTLGDICKISSGGTPKRSKQEYWKDGAIPWVKIGDIKAKHVATTEEYITEEGLKNSSAKWLEPGTLLFSIFASIGAVGILDIKATTNQAIAGLKIVAEDVSVDYLYHWLKSQEAISKSAGRGAAQSNINLGILRSMVVPIPPIDIQMEIASRFEAILSQISLAEKQVVLLDELVKSRFVEMFGDPIENPMGWPCQKMGELGELKNGVNFKAADSGFEIKCLGVGDFKDRYSITDMSLIATVSLSGSPTDKQMLKDGDIVFVRSNGNKQLVGRCLAVFPGGEPLTFSGFCIRFRNEYEGLLLDYLLGCLKSDSMRKAMVGRGANIQNLSQGILAEVLMPVPPVDLQKQFATFVQQADKLKFAAQQQIEKLQELYDSLAQEYFSA